MSTRTIWTPALFWSFVDTSGDCWLWTGRVASTGYGEANMTINGVGVGKAHRVAWTLANGGPPPPGMHVCHRCDVKQCVRPDHLFLGTRLDNMRDAAAKGRMASGDRHFFRRNPHLRRGELSPAAKLKIADVREIQRRHANGETQRVIAADYGISQGAVSMIVTGRRWGAALEAAR